jgi:hypothetical protein
LPSDRSESDFKNDLINYMKNNNEIPTNIFKRNQVHVSTQHIYDDRIENGG